MENMFIKLSDTDKEMIDRISRKLGKIFYGDYIDIESLLNLLSDLEDCYDDLMNEKYGEE